MNTLLRIRNLLLHPANEWMVIDEEEITISRIIIQYILPLALFRTIMTIMGWGIVGKSTQIDQLINIYPTKTWNIGIQYGITELLCALVAIYLLAYLIGLLAPAFRTSVPFNRSFVLATYSITPVWVAGVFNLFPVLAQAATFAALVYSLMILWNGLKTITKVPDVSRNPFFWFIAVALFMSYYFAQWLMFILVTFVFAGNSNPYSY